MSSVAASLALLLALGAPSAEATEAVQEGVVEDNGTEQVQPAAPVVPAPSDMQDRIAELEVRLAVLEAQAAQRDSLPAASTSVAQAGAVERARLSSPDGEAAVVLGGSVVTAGQEVGEAVSLAGPLDVYGRVLGNAVAVAGPVRVHPGAEVLGDAVSVVGPIEVAEGGVVQGERVSLGSIVGAALLEEGSPQMAGLLARGARRVAALLSLAATGVLLLAFWPRQIRRIAVVAMERPLWHGVAGFLLSLVALVTGLFLTVTLVGIPVAGLLAVVISSAWLLGFVALCFAIGDRIAPSPTRSVHWRTFLVGVVLVAALSLIPVLGPLVLALLGLVAIGAAGVSRFGNRMDPDAP